MDICGDERFEIIAKAKAHLLEATNIDTSPDEMKVLDNFLFRCWQMGWLDKYDEQTEPSTEATTGLPGPCIGCLKECEGCDFQKAKEAWERSQADCSWK